MDACLLRYVRVSVRVDCEVHVRGSAGQAFWGRPECKAGGDVAMIYAVCDCVCGMAHADGGIRATPGPDVGPAHSRPDVLKAPLGLVV